MRYGDIPISKSRCIHLGCFQRQSCRLPFLDENQTLSEDAMLEIAKQHRGFVSEVIYCKSHDGIFLTYYSSEGEVSFCGHGTIACMYTLIKNTPGLFSCSEIPIHTNKKGQLTVYNRIADEDAVFISAPNPGYLPTGLKPEDTAAPLDLCDEDLSREFPLEVIDAGLRTLIVPVKSFQKLVSIYPDEPCLKKFCLQNDIDIILIFSLNPADPENIAHTRVFAPRFGYLEDPATGSGNSAFGYYMLKHGIWDGSSCSLEQGGDDREFNRIKLRFQDDVLLFGGKATTRIDGVYYY
ncbi:PhzF family phenazine biosynthesis protein [Methanocorpusculum labreanum]|uniref:PhzF family phenazine biosynthesis protein n=1 Tax=Methanocorpusculum labreanum TaxID=83984 RepID=UPI000321E2A5|nr:PhzF family phenazine biosynthesis isomerase [Methanocorpusculum labreanum]